MRELLTKELDKVSGAGESCCYQPPKKEKCKQKGNNGFGNGPNDGVPGNSGFSDEDR